jgi:hypothetical protein
MLPMSLAVSACLASSVFAATITVGRVALLANQPSQWVEIGVTGGELVAGIDLFLQLGDGGPQLADFGLPPGKAAPKITGIDLKAGTIFQGVSDEPTNVSSAQLPQTGVFTLSLVGAVQAVPAQGRLARVQIDTTGFFGGTWPLRMDNVLPFDVFGGPYATNFAGLPASIQNGSVSIPITRGDYNANQQFDASDVDILAAALRAGSNDLTLYDLNGDRVVNWSDHGFWVRYYAHTYTGDANFDGQFNSSDLVQVLAEGKYEDDVVGNANWGSGDWNGDGDFTSADFVLALADGGFEQGPPRATAAAVPEPATKCLGWVGAVLILALRNRLHRPRVGGSSDQKAEI